MGHAWFVTGTDTGVGKTLVSVALLHALAARHARVVGMKPVAAGAERDADGRWANDDVQALRGASTIAVDASLDNPVLLPDPVSPHVAAARAGRSIDIATIARACAALRAQADAVVVEGAGGFRVPLSTTLDGADLAAALGLPLILVVGLRLGCLNHALLTAESIERHGLKLAGWVASRIDAAMPEQAANLELLRARLPAPCVGDVPWLAPPDARRAAACLDLDALEHA
jgi:dethiobiotin synthetase